MCGDAGTRTISSVETDRDTAGIRRCSQGAQHLAALERGTKNSACSRHGRQVRLVGGDGGGGARTPGLPGHSKWLVSY